MRYLWYYRYLIALLAGLVGVIVLCSEMSDREIDAKCAELMHYARTTRDTLDVKIACASLHDGADTRMAVGVASGVAAGAIAGSVGR